MKTYFPFALISFSFSALTLCTQTLAAVPVLHIDADQIVATVSPVFSGLMTEELNHSYDGGLYGELVQNRVFKNDAVQPLHWSLISGDQADAKIALDHSQPLNENLATSLRLDVTAASKKIRAGIANDGYWGIPVKPETTYHAAFYARAADFSGPVTVTLESADGATIFASAKVKHLTGNWQKYEVTLTTSRKITATTNARFTLSVHAPGTVWFNLVSLFPPTWNERPNGNRVDLMQKLADMKPRFLRFPGGNYLEGDTIATRFPWKQTLGDLTNRPSHPGCWSYRSSDGLGLLEFLEWAEDLNAEPVLAVYAGYSLKGMHVNPGAELEPFVQDALDEIEYVTGSTNTVWGARRAADGHPAPFKLTYVEIGNEDWFDKSGSYDGRFAQFYDAIKAKYTQLQCISTVGNEQPEALRVHSRMPDVVDEHYYRSAADFETEAPTRFEKYDRRGPKIFVGEWAAYEDIVPWSEPSKHLPPTPNLKAALADAAWMAAMERNSDIIVMQCYAPLLVNVNPGARQWRPNLIGYNALNSFGSPSYYAIAMFNTNHGDMVIHTTLDGLNDGKIAPLDYSVTKDTADGTIYIKVVNVTATPQPLKIDLGGAQKIAADGLSIVLTSDKLEDSNSITDPDHVVPVTEKINGLSSTFERTFAPYSVNILKIKTN